MQGKADRSLNLNVFIANEVFNAFWTLFLRKGFDSSICCFHVHIDGRHFDYVKKKSVESTVFHLVS